MNPFLFILLAGIVHILRPVHWLPFLILGRKENRRKITVIFFSTVSALIHSLLTLFFSFFSFWAGEILAKKTGIFFEKISAIILILAGALFPFLDRKEKSDEPAAKNSNLPLLSLFTGIHPGIEVVILIFAYSFKTIREILIAWSFYAGGALLTQAFLLYIFYDRGKMIKKKIYEKYGLLLTSTILILSGITILLWK